MKFFATFALLALFAVAYAQSQPVETENEKKTIPTVPEEQPQPDPARDKRGLLTYTGPISYTSYHAPYVYSSYHYPYAYSYRAYPYIYNPYYY